MVDALQKLDRSLEGEVRTDPLTLACYSVDASIHRLLPRAVVLPKSVDDVSAAVAFARERGLPVTPRGAATGTAGGCLGDGLVLDLAGLDQVLDLDPDARLVRCRPGVVQDHLNRDLAVHGLRLGPDTSTGNRATLGGMLGNNSSGAHSLRYGRMVDCVVQVELATADGQRLRLTEVAESAIQGLAVGAALPGPVYRMVERIRGPLAEAVRASFPAIGRRVAGYNLDLLLRPEGVNLSHLIAGSEGTLGVATEMTLRLERSPVCTGVSVVHFRALDDCLGAVAPILEHDPFALELIDDHILARGRVSPAMAGRLGWLKGEPNGLLVVEFDADSEAALSERLDRFEAAAARQGLGYTRHRITDPGRVADVWALRKAGLGLLMGRSRARGIAFLEDVAVPIPALPEFVGEFREILRECGKDAGFYGHAGAGCVHVRPMMDLRDPADAALLPTLMERVCERALAHGGTVSGEHGDGLVRSWLNPRQFGETVYGAFREMKHAFDPNRIMNPGKIVDAAPPMENLRFGPDTPLAEVATEFDFSADGGFALAAEICNGNAECRKCGSGVMCPSFQVTGREQDSTRGRATSLQAIVQGRLPLEELTGEALHEVMDLCLQCKGCRRECPSEVDMARFKAEFLQMYHRRHGFPLRSWLFGYVHELSRLASIAPSIANAVQRSAPVRALLACIGVDRRRELPTFARQRFSRWLRRQARRDPKPDSDRVVLFCDTWTEFNVPSIGQAAVTVLNALGVDLVVPAGDLCCGRSMISKGMLRGAKRKARKVVERLHPMVEEGRVVVGLEPSCILTIRDEYRDLVPGEKTERVADACLTIDEYLSRRIVDGGLPLPWKDDPLAVALHGHCHEKALAGTGPSLAVLRAVPGLQVTELDAGCCGMAGAFGYETEHYAFSLAVGETRLFPAIRALPEETALVVNGISCRAQIRDGTGRQAQHLIQLLANRLA